MARFTFLCFLISLCSCSAQPEQFALPTETIQTEILDAVNALRALGCTCGNEVFGSTSALSWNDQLEAAAGAHSQDMQAHDFFDHTGSDGSDAGDRILREGYSWMSYGENIAWGYTSVEEVVQGWKESPGHCRLMMDPKFKEMGAVRVSNYWTLTLGSR